MSKAMYGNWLELVITYLRGGEIGNSDCQVQPNNQAMINFALALLSELPLKKVPINSLRCLSDGLIVLAAYCSDSNQRRRIAFLIKQFDRVMPLRQTLDDLRCGIRETTTTSQLDLADMVFRQQNLAAIQALLG